MEIVEEVREKIERLLGEMRKAIVGQDEILEYLFVALLCEGHVLIEGVPGTAKTLMVRTLSRALGLDFSRIQFTPDLMPSDIVGTNIFEMQKGEFRLVKGPVFSELLLADEINRAPAKTQSALLEVMEEKRATIDGHSHTISDFFTVFATQNPVEYEGTYPLPEAVLDRFLIKIIVDDPSPEEEDQILRNFHQGFDARNLKNAGIEAVLTREDLIGLKQRVRSLKVDDSLIVYVRELIHATRNSPHILVGGSPRSSITLLFASKALATLAGRNFVTPDDIRRIIFPVLRHRLVLQPDAELEGLSADHIIRRILDQVKVPR
ncbi:MAG: MoxR family ATPase [Planctomycetota bacterium]|nr:MoxR family ATPase [Planctomycetota bacterium]